MPFYIFAWIGASGYGLTNIVEKLMSKYAIRFFAAGIMVFSALKLSG